MSRPRVSLGAPFTLEELALVAREGHGLVLPDGARERVDAARAVVDRLAEAGDEAPNVYGVNTGFGALAETRIRHRHNRDLAYSRMPIQQFFNFHDGNVFPAADYNIL